MQLLQDLSLRLGLRIVPQANPSLATFFSRKDNTRHTQIDAMLASTDYTDQVEIVVDSRKAIGADHDLLTLHAALAPRGPARPKRTPGRGP